MYLRHLCFLLLLFFSGFASAEYSYITDKILIDIFETPNQEKIIKSLPSGTVITVLEKKDGFSRIQTRDDITGWVQSKFLTTEKPTQIEYLQLVAKHNSAQDTIRDYENRLLEMQELRKEAKMVDWLRSEIKMGKDTESRLGKLLKEKDQEISDLNTTINGMQRELDNARLQLNEVLESMRLRTGEQEPGITDMSNSSSWFAGSLSIRTYTWLVLSLMVTLVIGILLGFVLIDHKIRKKHGDAPLY